MFNLILCSCAISFLAPPVFDANESLPKDIPPVVGIASISKPPGSNRNKEWNIRIDIPKIEWAVTGEIVPFKEWPELKTDIKNASLTLRMDGPSSLEPSRVVDLKGKELTTDEIVERMKAETPVLVSLSGKMPDAYYLQLTKSDALIVILGARDGYPLPEFLPAQGKVKDNTSQISR